MTEPEPSYSAFREARYGHGILDIKNRTHAYLTSHRNQDGEPVVADSVWLHNRCWGSDGKGLLGFRRRDASPLVGLRTHSAGR